MAEETANIFFNSLSLCRKPNLFFVGKDEHDNLKAEIRGWKTAILNVQKKKEMKKLRKNAKKEDRQLKWFWTRVLKIYTKKLAEKQKELEDMEVKC